MMKCSKGVDRLVILGVLEVANDSEWGAPYIVSGARWNLFPPGTLTRRAYTAT